MPGSDKANDRQADSGAARQAGGRRNSCPPAVRDDGERSLLGCGK